jgi:2-oxoglutarate ferredoxin oxidoreductase subunit delta
MPSIYSQTRRHMPKGTVVVDGERCKGCGLCISFCPEDVLAYSDEYNQSGYNIVYMKEPERCIGCAFCAQTCPDVAIEVYREKKPPQRK